MLVLTYSLFLQQLINSKLNIMKLSSTLKTSLLFAGMLVASLSSFAQLRTMYFGTPTTVCDTVTVPVNVRNYTLMSGYSVSIRFDTLALTYLGSTPGSSAIATGITVNPSNTTNTPYELGMLWNDVSGKGTTGANGATILTLSFLKTPGFSGNTVLDFDLSSNAFVAPEIDTTDSKANIGTAFDTAFIPSVIAISNIVTPDPAISQNGNIFTAVTTGATNAPIWYQWYDVVSSGPGGPGTVISYIPITPGGKIDSATFHYSITTGETIIVEVTYANGCVIMAGNGVVPVKLINFGAKASDRTNVLSWTTANEVNFSSFVVERSINGVDFSTVGSVKATGKATAEQTYSYTDANVSALATCYYRLKMVDNNGSFTYSNVVKLSKEVKAIFQIQSNPVVNTTLRVLGNNMKAAKVYNTNGQLVLNQTIDTNSADINVSALSKGMYLINITAVDGTTQTEKFMVK